VNKRLKTQWVLLGTLIASVCFGEDSDSIRSLGDISDTVMGLIFMSTDLFSVVFFMLAMGFAVGATVRFRVHFKNPSAMPLLTPILMSFLALIMLCFNLFNTWKQKEVFGGKKPPVFHIKIAKYNDKSPVRKTPIQALRDRENAAKLPPAAPVYSTQPQYTAVEPPRPQYAQNDEDDDYDQDYSTLLPHSGDADV
jgi:hypothetical protein